MLGAPSASSSGSGGSGGGAGGALSGVPSSSGLPDDQTVHQARVILFIGSYAASLLTMSIAFLLTRLCCCSAERKRCSRLPGTASAWRYLLLTGAGFSGWFSISVSFSLFNKLVLSYLQNGVFKVPFFITCIHFLVKLICMLLWVTLVKPVMPSLLRRALVCVDRCGGCSALESARSTLEAAAAAADGSGRNHSHKHSCREICVKFVPIGIFTG